MERIVVNNYFFFFSDIWSNCCLEVGRRLECLFPSSTLSPTNIRNLTNKFPKEQETISLTPYSNKFPGMRIFYIVSS